MHSINSAVSFLRPRCRSRRLTAFGRAQLLLTAEGQLEVRGGTRTDQTAVREWISLFMHEAVPRFFPD